MKQRIEFIDFARAFAILGIALYHYLMPLSDERWFQLAINFGGSGIHLFFFLSGFGLGMASYKSALNFYKRRFTKIILPYYIFITLIFLFNLVIPIYPENGWRDYFAHIFFYKMFSNQSIGSFGYHLWFMSTLIQFYIVFPFIKLLIKKWKGVGLIIVSLIVSILYIFIVVKIGHEYDRTWNSFFLAYLWEFVLGVVLGNQHSTKIFEFPIFSYVILWVLGLILMAFFTLKLGQIGRLFNDIPAFISITSFTLLVYYLLPRLRLKTVNQFFIHQGKLSYEFYLVHFFAFSVFIYLKNVGLINYGWWTVPVMLLFSWILAKLLNQLNQKILARI